MDRPIRGSISKFGALWQMLKAFKRFLPSGHFARSILLLTSGTMGAQVLMMASAPFLTRLYDPRDYGILAVVAGVVAVVAVISSGRYEVAIVAPKDDRSALNVLALALILNVFVTVIAALLLVAFREPIAGALNMAEPNYLLMAPIGVLTTGCYRAFYYWGVRKKAFGDIAVTRFQQSFALIVTQAVGSVFGTIGLLTGQVVSAGVGATRLARNAWNAWGRDGGITFSRISEQARIYRNYPLYDVWAGLMNNGSFQAPPFILAASFGPSKAGLFALAMRVLVMPMDVLGSAMSNFLLTSGNDIRDKNALDDAVLQLALLCFQIILPPFLVLWLYATPIFEFVFGSAWAEVGSLVTWLIPMLLIRFVASPISSAIYIVQKQNLSLVWQAVYFLASAGALLVGASYGFDTAVILYSVAGGTWYAVLIVAIFAICKVHLLPALADFVFGGIWALCFCAPAILAAALDLTGVKLVCCAIVLCATLGYYYSGVLKNISSIDLTIRG